MLLPGLVEALLVLAPAASESKQVPLISPLNTAVVLCFFMRFTTGPLCLRLLEGDGSGFSVSLGIRSVSCCFSLAVSVAGKKYA